jgi:hypothetical protein
VAPDRTPRNMVLNDADRSPPVQFDLVSQAFKLNGGLADPRGGRGCEDGSTSVIQCGTAGSQRRNGFAVWLRSQIGTRCHQPSPTDTGRYSVVQPHQSGIRRVSGDGVPPCAPEVARAQAHRGDLAATGPAGHRGAAWTLRVEPGGRGHLGEITVMRTDPANSTPRCASRGVPPRM